MMISSENTGKVTEEESFPCTASFKKGGCDFILCRVCWCWVQKKYSNFKSQNVQNSKQIYQRIFQI